MIYVLTYPNFEPGLAERIRRFRIENEPVRAGMVPPHITLVFGFRDARPKELFELCEALADRSSQFDVGFASSHVVYDPFENAHKLFLVASAGSSRLAELHQQLNDGPHRGELKVDIPYRPHMTVATNDDRTIIERLDVAALGSFPLFGTIRALEVVELADGKLHCLRTIPFAKLK